MNPSEYNELPLWKRMQLLKLYNRYYKAMRWEEFLHGVDIDFEEPD